jgi:hypothetical protein
MSRPSLPPEQARKVTMSARVKPSAAVVFDRKAEPPTLAGF